VTPVLQLEAVYAGYGQFQALFDVSLAVQPGEAVALLGANGVGKTTVARVASGLVAPTEGRVVVGGDDLTGSPPWAFARAGVAHAPEGRSVFATLSVEENLKLFFRRSMGAKGVAGALDRAYEQFPVLAQRRGQLAGQLSGGQQRMLSLARVLVESPALLVADELSLGLAPIVIDEIAGQLTRIRDEGTALLIIEQEVSLALALCDRAVLLERGRVAWQGSPAEAAERVVSRVFDHHDVP
jgi:branched-chain amino acid transport system ATP-binding protein